MKPTKLSHLVFLLAFLCYVSHRFSSPSAQVLDTDGDGLPDAYELAHGLDPNDPGDASLDSDGDGFSNLEEFQAGTDPQNPEDEPKIVATSEFNGEIRISFATVLGKAYRVEFSSVLPTNNWTIVAGRVVGTGGIVDVGDTTTASLSSGFYRVQMLTDSDGDGMPDEWEIRFGLNPNVDDAQIDLDNDGLTNLTEYLQGRDPTKGAIPDNAGLVNLNVFTPLE